MAIPHVCRLEPGATAERLVERIADVTSATRIAAVARTLVSEGVLEVRGEGWAVVPRPDPVEEVERLRAALGAVVAEPDPDEMTRLAQEALDVTGGRS